MEEKNKISKGVLIGTIVSSVILVIVITVMLFIYFNAPEEVKKEELSGGDIKLTYSDDSSILNITNLSLLDDTSGMKNDAAAYYFDFSVGIILDEASQIDYEISVIPNKTTTIPIKYVKVYLEKLDSGTFSSVMSPEILTISKEKSELGSKVGSMVLHKDTTKKTVNNNYRLRAWVDSASMYQIQPTDIISLTVEVNGKAS